MPKRLISTLLLLAALALLTVGCGNDNDVKVERHEEINVEETTETRMKVE